MPETMLRIRASRERGELEVEGSPEAVAEWWEKLWPEIAEANIGLRSPAGASSKSSGSAKDSLSSDGMGTPPAIFGEYLAMFRTDVTDVDKVLIAGAFLQDSNAEKSFTTRTANNLLIEQNVKVANASECVRRLTSTRRAFVISNGHFRVSATGAEHLKTLKAQA